MENGLKTGNEAVLHTIVGNTGLLDRDDHGQWDYHGPTSGLYFVQRLRKQLGVVETPERCTMPLGSPGSMSISLLSQDASLPPTHLLPSQGVALQLCRNALDNACCFMCLVIEHDFFASLDRIYAIPIEQFNNEDNSFLTLLYIVMAVGFLFSGDGSGTLNLTDYEGAIVYGYLI